MGYRRDRFYSSVFLNFMTTTDKTREAVPSATQAAWGSQSAVVNPTAAHCAKLDKMYPHPPINSTQTVIVARALNICGIFNPPVNSVVNNIYHNSGVSTGLRRDYLSVW
jgi:hypothetical protein